EPPDGRLARAEEPGHRLLGTRLLRRHRHGCIVAPRARAGQAGGSRRPAAVPSAPTMALSDVWARTLVYFGIAEEEDWDEDGYLTEDELADPYERPNVRRLPARRSRA